MTVPSCSRRVHEFALPHSVRFEHGPRAVCLRDGERPVFTVAGDLHVEYQRDVSHVRCSKAAHQLLLEHLEHCFIASSENQVVDVEGEDGLWLPARVRCAAVNAVVVRVVDADAGVTLERFEANLHHPGVAGAVPIFGALSKTVQAFVKSQYQ